MTVQRNAEPDRLVTALRSVDTLRRVGRVAEARGTLIRVTGINARIGEVCELRDAGNPQPLMAEVVAIERGMTVLLPMGTLEGLSAGTEVVSTGLRATVGAGPALMGRTLDALGNVVDGQAVPPDLIQVPVYREAPDPLKRAPIRRPFHSTVRSIDSVLTMGEGQRVGIFAAARTGTSTLLGMLARAPADVNVIVLVGGRGQDVREFIESHLGVAGLNGSVVVVATSDRPALERIRAAHVGTAIAEYFRDQGRRVLLLLDSVTCFARALRDVGLAVGEQQARGGYPPSVFSALPKLLERAGNNDHGSITAFYTFQLDDEQDDYAGDPVAEEARCILDGHIYMSRRLAAAGHYPAIDVLASASRAMPLVTEGKHQRAAAALRQQMSSDAGSDEARRNLQAIRRLLQQPAGQSYDFEQSVGALTGMFLVGGQ